LIQKAAENVNDALPVKRVGRLFLKVSTVSSTGAFDEIIAHHSHVFVFQVVTVIEKKTRVVSEAHQDSDPLAGHQQYRILQAFIHIAFVRDTLPFENLELLPVQVDRVGHLHHAHHPHATVLIDELPYLYRPSYPHQRAG